METLVAKRYAKALSGSVKNVEEAVALLEGIGKALDTEEVAKIIDSPIVDKEKKTSLIVDAVSDKIDETILRFLKILGEHERLGLIPEIVRVLRGDLQRQANRYEGVVESASTIADEKVAALQKALSDYSGAHIELTARQSDIDGLRVRVDDLGLEVNFSKERVKTQLIDYIKQSL